MHKRGSASAVALCGVLGALAVVVMLAGELVPLATFCCPVLVMFLMVPILYECGGKLAMVWYAAVSLLSLIFTSANPEAAMIYVVLGYYPVVRKYFDRIRPLALRILCKLLLFNGAVAVAYCVLIFLFRLDAILQEFQQAQIALTIVTVLLANFCFFLTEQVLKRFEVFYVAKLRKKLHFK